MWSKSLRKCWFKASGLKLVGSLQVAGLNDMHSEDCLKLPWASASNGFRYPDFGLWYSSLSLTNKLKSSFGLIWWGAGDELAMTYSRLPLEWNGLPPSTCLVVFSVWQGPISVTGACVSVHLITSDSANVLVVARFSVSSIKPILSKVDSHSRVTSTLNLGPTVRHPRKEF